MGKSDIEAEGQPGAGTEPRFAPDQQVDRDVLAERAAQTDFPGRGAVRIAEFGEQVPRCIEREFRSQAAGDGAKA